MHGTRGVVGLDPLVAGYEVVSEAGLVAQTPDDDAGVVEIPLHHSLIPLEVGLSVSGVLGQGLLTVAHTVGLYIGLVYHIEAVAVAEVIPAGVVGIVACAHCIDVEALHYLNVADHLLLCHQIPAAGADLMTVDTLDKDGLTVDQELTAADLHLAETYIDRGLLRHTLGSGHHSVQTVERGGLGRPFCGRAETGRSLERTVSGDIGHRRPYRPALGRGKGKPHILHSFRHLALNSQGTVLIGCVEVRGSLQSQETLRAAGIEIALACHSVEPPEVLVLEIGAVAPAEHLEGEQVFLSGLDIRRDVEDRLHLAVLAVSHVLSVDIEGDVGCH